MDLLKNKNAAEAAYSIIVYLKIIFRDNRLCVSHHTGSVSEVSFITAQKVVKEGTERA